MSGDSMMHHFGWGVPDVNKSKQFYEAILTPLGYKFAFSFPTPDDPTKMVTAAFANPQGFPEFWIGLARSEDRIGRGIHLAFKAPNKEAVHAAYDAAIAAGAKDNGPPGPRDYRPGYYAAFVFDEFGNNIEFIDASVKSEYGS